MKITHNHLVDIGACEEERERFIECFGPELELPTELEAQQKLAAELVKYEFHMFWAAFNLMEFDKYSEWRLFEEKRLEDYYGICDWEIRPTREKARITYQTECWLKMIQLMVGEMYFFKFVDDFWYAYPVIDGKVADYWIAEWCHLLQENKEHWHAWENEAHWPCKSKEEFFTHFTKGELYLTHDLTQKNGTFVVRAWVENTLYYRWWNTQTFGTRHIGSGEFDFPCKSLENFIAYIQEKESQPVITFQAKEYAAVPGILHSAFRSDIYIGYWWESSEILWDNEEQKHFECTSLSAFKAHFERKKMDTAPKEEEKWYLQILNLAVPQLTVIYLEEFASKEEAENAMRNLSCFPRPFCLDTKEGPFWVEEGNTLIISQ